MTMPPELLLRYTRAMHAVQSALALEVTKTFEGTNVHTDAELPLGRYLKGMRTAVDGTKADQGALMTLLIAKGVITADEYYLAITEAAERERDMQTERVREKFNLPDGVRFG